MRIGQNPQKGNDNKLIKKYHRIVMVFYVPDIIDAESDSYFCNLSTVLDISLQSLINTVNFKTTNITLINNASSKSVDIIIQKFLDYIDKYVVYNENKGKVNAVINEARGVYEEFITITDADILFYPGWEKASIELFRDFRNVGAVSPYPFPYSPFYVNKSSFGFNTIFGKIEYGKYINESDIDFYIKGTGLPNIIKRDATKQDWKTKHFVLRNNDKIAVVGSYHVTGTYRSFIFKNEKEFPEVVFKNQYEERFIDCLADRKGLIKLSTLKTYVYHIGNNIDDVVEKYQFHKIKKDIIEESLFEQVIKENSNLKLGIYFNRVLGYFFIKYLWKKLN